MLATKTVLYQDDKVQAKVVVAKATVRRGLLRSHLADEGIRIEHEDALEHLFAWMQYPAAIAGAVSGEVSISGIAFSACELSLKQFLELPEELAVDWLDAVFELNPHWVYKKAEDPKSAEGKKQRRSAKKSKTT